MAEAGHAGGSAGFSVDRYRRLAVALAWCTLAIVGTGSVSGYIDAFASPKALVGAIAHSPTVAPSELATATFSSAATSTASSANLRAAIGGTEAAALAPEPPAVLPPPQEESTPRADAALPSPPAAAPLSASTLAPPPPVPAPAPAPSEESAQSADVELSSSPSAPTPLSEVVTPAPAEPVATSPLEESNASSAATTASPLPAVTPLSEVVTPAPTAPVAAPPVEASNASSAATPASPLPAVAPLSEAATPAPVPPEVATPAPVPPEVPQLPVPTLPQVLLHVGPHRTGSSAFQVSMQRCAISSGYPAATWQNFNGTGPKSAVSLARGLVTSSSSMLLHKPPPEVTAVKEWLRAVPGNKIMSSEVFSFLAPSRSLFFSSLFPGHHVTVVWVHRNSVSQVLAVYHKMVEMQQTPALPFDEWAGSTNILNISGGRMQEWQTNLQGYIDAFGWDHARVVDYDGALAAGWQLHDAILAAGGLPVAPNPCRPPKGLAASKDLKPLLMKEVFKKYVRGRHCELTPRTPNLTHLLQLQMPEKCSGLPTLVTRGEEMDGEFRRRFGNITLFANASASAAAAQAKLPYCQLDVEEVQKSWQSALEQQFLDVLDRLNCGSDAVLFHIGPHKTGSTAFQAKVRRCIFLGDYEAAKWQNLERAAKSTAAAALAMMRGSVANLHLKLPEEVTTIQRWVQSTPGAKIVSSEAFSAMRPRRTQLLLPVFEGQSVTVVWVHRNPFTMSLSVYNQLMKTNLTVVLPFEDWLWNASRDVNKHLDKSENLDGYITAFGRNHVKVVDYDGARAAGWDVTDAVLSVAGLPPLPKICHNESVVSNPSVDVDPVLLRYAFERYAAKQSCELTDATPTKLTYLQQFPFPRTCSQLPMHVAWAKEKDDEFRQRFGDLIHYADPNATSAAVQQRLPFCQLDVNKVLETWDDRLAEQLKEASATLKCGSKL